jgi:hypothetical protein
MNRKEHINHLFDKKQKGRLILLIIVFLGVSGGFICFWGCQRDCLYPAEIEKVLQQAGSNGKELEKVLAHYSRDAADSLKLRAAEFLIVNMPEKYSVDYDAPWESIATVCLRWTSSSNKQLVLDTYHMGEQIVREDIRYITADYLIANIEQAFKVWRETPWGKHIPFTVFCEEILPYRVEAEPLENWREKVLIGFSDLYRELRSDSSMTAVEACAKVNARLPQFRMDKDFPPMRYSTLMASTRNTCAGMSALAIFTMRAMGIPVTFDFTIQYPYSRTGHSWNSVCDSSVNHISFMGAQSAPGESHQGTDEINSKVYRKMFSLQNPIRTEERHIPPKLRDYQIKDISGEYAGHTDIDVPVRFPPPINAGYAYLATLLFNAGAIQWNPIAWGQVQGQYIHYDQLGKSILYLPIYYANNQQTPAGYPFYLDRAGNMQFFEPDIASSRQHVFYESGRPSRNGDKTKILTETTYELLYWDGANWQSLGSQASKDASVSFRVPGNALMYLRTVGGTNDNFPIFCIQDNKQHWLYSNNLLHKNL